MRERWYQPPTPAEKRRDAFQEPHSQNAVSTFLEMKCRKNESTERRLFDIIELLQLRFTRNLYGKRKHLFEFPPQHRRSIQLLQIGLWRRVSGRYPSNGRSSFAAGPTAAC